MRILPGNAQHIGARHSQQDSFGFADPGDQAFLAHGGFLAVVCDGMGGMEHGDAASRAAVRGFLEAYHRKTPEESIPEALERGAREANREVVELATQLGLVENMGTTLVAAVLTPGAMYYISVGDSALYLVSGGQARMINHPHVFANLLERAVERGVMSREDADSHPERESLTSFIGTEKLEEIDHNLEPYTLAPGDAVLLASDGMFKTLEPDEMQACLHGAPQSWPETLVALTIAKHREYQDNVTVLSVCMEDEDSLPPLARRKNPDLDKTLPLDARRTVLMARPPVADAPSASSVPVPEAAANAAAVERPQSPPAMPPSLPPIAPPPAPDWTPPRSGIAPPAAPVTSRRWVATAILLVLVLVAGAAAAGWRWHLQHQAAPKPGVESTSAPGAPPAGEVPPAAASGAVPTPTDEHAPPRSDTHPQPKAK